MDLSYEEIKSLPKVDLHRHLQGSMRLETAYELASSNKGIRRGLEREGVDLSSIETFRKFVRFSTLPGSLSKFLRPWRIFDRIMNHEDLVARVAYEAIEDAARDNVCYLELRFALDIPGLGPCGVLEGVVKGAKLADEKYPKTIVRAIASLTRHKSQYSTFYNEFLEMLMDGYYDYVVGFDITGNENYPLERFVSVINFFRELGLGVTVHAGETGNSRSLKNILNVVQPDRIGHGNAAVKRQKLIDVIAERGIAVESSLTCNLYTGACKDLREHPLKRFREAGVRVTISTDNPGVCETTLTEEYVKAINSGLIKREDLPQIIMDGVDVSFLEQDQKDWLRKIIKEEWQDLRQLKLFET